MGGLNKSSLLFIFAKNSHDIMREISHNIILKGELKMNGAGKVFLYAVVILATGGLAIPILMVCESNREKREMRRGLEEELKRLKENDNKEYKVVKCRRIRDKK